jgi:AmiR/NasT family two-component response regulator
MSIPLHELRFLQIQVVHQPDVDRDVLVRQLHRIGCRVDVEWPPPKAAPLWADIAFLMIGENFDSSLNRSWFELKESGPALIAVVDYEDPTTLQTVLDLSPNAVVGKPLQPYGVLSNLVVARQAKLRHANDHQKIMQLEQKLNSVRVVSQAKALVMKQFGLSEDEAHHFLRKQAMATRKTVEELAGSLVMANGILTGLSSLDRPRAPGSIRPTGR